MPLSNMQTRVAPPPSPPISTLPRIAGQVNQGAGVDRLDCRDTKAIKSRNA